MNIWSAFGLQEAPRPQGDKKIITGNGIRQGNALSIVLIGRFLA